MRFKRQLELYLKTCSPESMSFICGEVTLNIHIHTTYVYMCILKKICLWFPYKQLTIYFFSCCFLNIIMRILNFLRILSIESRKKKIKNEKVMWLICPIWSADQNRKFENFITQLSTFNTFAFICGINMHFN